MKNKKLLLLLLPFITGCSSNNPQVGVFSYQTSFIFIEDELVMPLNTSCIINYYGNSKDEIFTTRFDTAVWDVSKAIDRYHEYSQLENLYTLNNNHELSDTNEYLYNCLKISYDMTKLTKGKFNMFMGEIIDLYKDSIDNSDVSLMPNSEAVSKAIYDIPSYEIIDQIITFDDETRTVTVNEYNNKYPIISLGGIGKGYCGDVVVDKLKNDDKSFLLNLGSSTIATKGNNPTKENGKYTIGFRLPILASSGLESGVSNYITVGSGYNISTSGDYENCYLYDNNTKLMHHIINPYTGYSNNTYRSVSLISNNLNMTVLDALSTAVFNSSSDEEAIELINDIETYYQASIDYMLLKPVVNDGVIDFAKFTPTISEGFSNIITGTFEERIIL